MVPAPHGAVLFLINAHGDRSNSQLAMGVPRWLSTVRLTLLAILFLVHGTAAAPTEGVSKTTAPSRSSGLTPLDPHLFLKDGSKMQEDIFTFYSSKHCPFDVKIIVLFEDGSDLFEAGVAGLNVASVYNQVIPLLSLIENSQWTDDMCKASLLLDLTSHHFCSASQSDLPISEELVQGLNATGYARVGWVISSLLKAQGSQLLCDRVCGKEPVSGLCYMYVMLADFLLTKRVEQIRASE